MTDQATTIFAWSYGLAGFGYAAFALHLGFGWRGGLRGLALLVSIGFSAAWGLLALGFALTGYPILLWASQLLDTLRIGAWFAFLLLLISRPSSVDASGNVSRLVWGFPAATALTLVSLVAQLMILAGFRVWGEPARLAVLTSMAMAVFGLVLIEQLFRNVPQDTRWNIKPLCLGLTGAFAFDIYLYADALLFNRLDSDALSARGFVEALVIPLVAVTTARNRDWTFKVTLSRRVVFHSAALAASGIYLLFVAAAGYYVRFFGGSWGRSFQVALSFAALLLFGQLAFSGSVRAKLRVLVNKHFFAYRYDYRDEWLKFTQALSTNAGQGELGQQVIRGLADMVESPGGQIWLKDSTERQFVHSASWNMARTSAVEDTAGELAQFLGESGWVVNLEEFRSSPGRYGNLRLPPWLSQIANAWLVIPLVSGVDMVGFVILTTARTQVDVNWEVNDLLKTAGRQAASYLGQLQATEALLEARKFDAFNRMSAFVVHDLKNIVAQLSLMLKNAERHRDNPEFRKDMLMTVEHSVERMKQLMLQLRDGTTPVDSPRGVDLAAVIRRIQQSKTGLDIGLELQLNERVIARGHDDRVERVIGHIVQNAIDATDKTGRVWIRLERLGEQAMVEVGDTGHGMTSEFVRDRLFKPFQTTKQGGMGIGAYESFQYVQELGGRVLVDSTPNVGTRVRLLLPLYEARVPTEMAHKEVA